MAERYSKQWNMDTYGLRDPSNWFDALMASGDEKAIAEYRATLDEYERRQIEQKRLTDIAFKDYYRRKKTGETEASPEATDAWNKYMYNLYQNMLDGYDGKPSQLENLMERRNLSESERQAVLDRRFKLFPWREYEWENWKAGGWG